MLSNLDHRVLINSAYLKKIFALLLFLFSIDIKAQVFIPHSNWQDLRLCTATYCPTPNPVAATLQGTGGSTQIVNIGTCAASGAGDDQNVAITLPFNFAINSVAYRDWYVASNTYLTAGAGFNTYNNLSGSVPNARKIHLGAADNSYKQVYYTSGTNYFRVRYQGYASTDCTGTAIVFEFTFYRPDGMGNQYAVVVFGTHGRTNGQFGLASQTAYYVNQTVSSGVPTGTSATQPVGPGPGITANTSYLFTSNNSGITWTLQQGWSITGTGTNL